jgi:hypothetical protein
VHLIGFLVRNDRQDFLDAKLRLVIHGFSSRRRHTIIISWPPGRIALRMLRIAAPGEVKNIVPKRENTKS